MDSLLTGIIFNIQRFSVHDGPGIRTTVFLKGCPLRCKWCHNPESLLGQGQVMLRRGRCIRCGDCLALCPQQALSWEEGEVRTDWVRCRQCGACARACVAEAREWVGREMDVAGLMAEIVKDVPYFDESGGGVTFSGGEPLLQHEFLQGMLAACRERGIHAAVDTTGYATPEVLRKISPLGDLFLFDLKLIDDSRHRELTGASNQPILDNLRDLVREGRNIEVRLPLIPGCTDTPENVRRTGEFLGALNPAPGIQILPYHAAGLDKYERLGMKPEMAEGISVSGEEIDRVASELRRFGLKVRTEE